MKSPIYLQMAEDGLVMPLATNMVLHGGSSEADIERALGNGEELGRVLVRAPRRFGVPLAVPHMDLRLEKELLLEGLRLGPGSAPRFHFKQAPTTTEVQAMTTALAAPLPPALQAQVDAVRFVLGSAPRPCPLRHDHRAVLADDHPARGIPSRPSTWPVLGPPRPRSPPSHCSTWLSTCPCALWSGLCAPSCDRGGEAGSAVRTGRQ